MRVQSFELRVESFEWRIEGFELGVEGFEGFGDRKVLKTLVYTAERSWQVSWITGHSRVKGSAGLTSWAADD